MWVQDFCGFLLFFNLKYKRPSQKKNQLLTDFFCIMKLNVLYVAVSEQISQNKSVKHQYLFVYMYVSWLCFQEKL